MKFAVLLHGSGVHDGTEIHEAVLSILSIVEHGHEYQCIAPDFNQYHVINHADGTVMNESRNIWIESARIARGNVLKLQDINVEEYDALIMPGGSGTAKNLTNWAFEGPNGTIDEMTQNLILDFVKAQKPIGAFCMSPTTVAKALQGSKYHPTLSVGTTELSSPYDILAISEAVNSIGAQSVMKSVVEISTDVNNKIICAPCYMMEANIADVKKNIDIAIEAIIALSEE